VSDPKSPQAADAMSLAVCEHGNVQFLLYDETGEVFATAAFSFESGCTFVKEAIERLERFRAARAGLH
jgi:hypothetical protein